MGKIYSKEELIQIVLTSKKVELKSIYPASTRYFSDQHGMISLLGFVINETYFADEYSGKIYMVDDPNMAEVENLDEFDF